MKNILYKEIQISSEISQYEKPLHHHTGRIFIFVILISMLLALMVEGAGVAFHRLNPTPVRTVTETHAFSLGSDTQPTLVVKNDHGFVHVRPGTDNTMTITATKIGDSYGAGPDDFKVNYSQSGNVVTVQVRNNSIHPFDLFNSSQADLDVTVPVNCDLRLQTNLMSISVTGIRGKMVLTSNVGELQVMDVSLKSVSLLSTNSGSIMMRGSIGTTGYYLFQSNTSVIDVALPRSTSFHAELVSNSGTITSEFPIASTYLQLPGIYRRMVKGDIGSSPQATVIIQSGTGPLHLRKM